MSGESLERVPVRGNVHPAMKRVLNVANVAPEPLFATAPANGVLLESVLVRVYAIPGTRFPRNVN